MKTIQTNLSPLSFRCAMLVLLPVFLIQATSSAQTAEYTQSFESYNIGTSAADIEHVFSNGVWDSATVADGGPGGSKELCVTPTTHFFSGSFGFGGSDFLPPMVPIPLQGSASVSTSYDFRVQSNGTASFPLPLYNEVGIANVGFWENSSNRICAVVTAWNEGDGIDRLNLVICDGSDDPYSISYRPFDDLGFALDSPGEWSDYFSLQLNVELDYSPNSPASGVAVANLVDADGNVLLSTSKEMSSFPLVSSATGAIFLPYIFLNDDYFDNLSAACFDNLSHSVTFVSTPLIGDANVDGEVNFFDIAPFISILASGGYLAQADANQDGVVDFLDIHLFIEALSSQ